LFFSFFFTPKDFAALPKFYNYKNIFDIITAPTIQPTEQPTPTEAPIPTETPASTQSETTQTPSPPPSPTTIQKTPTPTQKPNQRLTQKEMIMYGVIGFLVLVILLQNFPKIKKWLHEKTA
jgi:cell division septation protein DedD